MYKVLTNVVIGFFLIAIALGETTDDSIGRILTGVSENTVAVKSISFDYSMEYLLSEQWKTKKKELWQRQLNERQIPEPLREELSRAPSIEPTLRSGTFIRDGAAFKITNKVVARSDQKLFIDELTISDGVKLTKVNFKSKSAAISNAKDYNNAALNYFPDKFQFLFLDGRTIQEIFESGRSDFVYIGRQQYDGTECEVFEISRSYKTPEGMDNFTKDRVWVAPQNGFLIKKGISFKTDLSKPINSIKAEFKEVSKGLRYYSKIVFESFPSGDIEPDVTMILTISDIKINQILPKETFLPDLTGIPNVMDETQIR